MKKILKQIPRFSGSGVCAMKSAAPAILPFLLIMLGLPASWSVAQQAASVSPKLIDFGRVRRGITLKDSLGITNTGDRLLKVKTVGSTCGCTVTAAGRYELDPGDTLFIPFLLNTKGYRGLIRKTITVYFEKNQPRPLRFELQADIFADFDIKPRYLYLQKIPVDSVNASHHTFQFTNNMAKALHIKKITTENTMLSISPETFTVHPGKSRSFKLRLTPAQAGRHHIQVYVDSDYEAQPRTIIPVYLHIVE